MFFEPFGFGGVLAKRKNVISSFRIVRSKGQTDYRATSHSGANSLVERSNWAGGTLESAFSAVA
jgi:hypothetical protein